MVKQVRSGRELRVLIVGGGPSGLTLAGLMSQRGHYPTIVDSLHKYDQVGYVMSLIPVGTRIFKGLNLYDKLLERGIALKGYEILDDEGKQLNYYNIGHFFHKYGPNMVLTRSELIDILKEGLVRTTPHLCTTVDKIVEKKNEVEVTFSDGTTQPFDLVVGSDGIHSKVRKLVFGEYLPDYSGLTIWAFWTHCKFNEQIPMIREFWGKGRYFGVYPARGAQACFLRLKSPSNVPDPQAERIGKIKQHFSGMGTFVDTILDKLEEEKAPESIFHADLSDLRIPQWYKGRVVLIGDAAHAFLPTAGMGASMAMESAVVLSEELLLTDSKHIPMMLQHYVKRRRKRVESAQRFSRNLAKILTITNPALVGFRDMMLKHYLTEKRVFASWERLINERV